MQCVSGEFCEHRGKDTVRWHCALGNTAIADQRCTVPATVDVGGKHEYSSSATLLNGVPLTPLCVHIARACCSMITDRRALGRTVEAHADARNARFPFIDHTVMLDSNRGFSSVNHTRDNKQTTPHHTNWGSRHCSLCETTTQHTAAGLQVDASMKTAHVAIAVAVLMVRCVTGGHLCLEVPGLGLCDCCCCHPRRPFRWMRVLLCDLCSGDVRDISCLNNPLATPCMCVCKRRTARCVLACGQWFSRNNLRSASHAWAAPRTRFLCL